MIAAIAARSRNGVIGSNNAIPWHLADDMKYFRETTSGHAVIMGRKTAESIVAYLGHGLPDRQNIVVTRDSVYTLAGFAVTHSIEDAIKSAGPDSFVIGGEQIYAQALPYCEKLYITEVDADVEGDAHFPDLDTFEWRETSREAHQKDNKNDYDFDFVVYDRLTDGVA
jgi:dihydrofolate reductase